MFVSSKRFSAPLIEVFSFPLAPHGLEIGRERPRPPVIQESQEFLEYLLPCLVQDHDFNPCVRSQLQGDWFIEHNHLPIEMAAYTCHDVASHWWNVVKH
jgi:hypothetical protein